MSDLAIAQAAVLKPILEVGATLGLGPEDLEPYGHYKAKIPLHVVRRLEREPDGALVLVSAISPTPAGEGKTTVTIGLGDALRRIGRRAVIALREPSLGPAFGVKGGATGGGQAQVVPMEDINLHMTGDFHAVTAANNLLAAMIDNHLHHGNALGLDPRRLAFRRVMDVNDRALRHTTVGLGGWAGGVPREEGFMITPASEVMAILCLASDLTDLKARCARIIVGQNRAGQAVTAGDLGAAGAMAALLRDALKPNLVQTLAHTPALVHGGPFANIAHGCNSVQATRLALKLGDVVVTEAGFGADLGAEKFIDIKCRLTGLRPGAVVLVATIRSLKMHGGLSKADLGRPDTMALRRGMANLRRHVTNVTQVYGLPCVVALNPFPADTPDELTVLQEEVAAMGVRLVSARVHADGASGGEELARAVLDLLERPSSFSFVYDDADAVEDRVHKVATRIYGASGVSWSPKARAALAEIAKGPLAFAPVCVAKTPYSFSDDPLRPGAPEDWTLRVVDVRPVAGAGFVLVLAGDIMTMPGLPEIPAAQGIDVDGDGRITGLF
ncbi:MAG: formate--tetrahydrofolate ligase [Candidatus Sericytochromatia bacterium]|nr:formate--tetrahydrofolate ligase [Candidatus Sericytochromatia bacterium]